MSSSLKVLRAVCPHDCPDTCSIKVTVDTASGRAVKLRGDPEHTTTGGFLCVKVNHYLERTYSPDRLLHPLRRVGAKGEGRFERISWDEALALVSARLQAIAARNPEAILPYSYSGTLGLIQNGSLDHRFFHRLGASRLDRTICATCGTEALNQTIGWRVGPEPASFEHARYIVLWGTNTLTSNVHLWPFIQRAREAGAKLVVIDPIRTRTAQRADEWIPIRPGTDAALALGMMHVIFRDGLADRDYLGRYTEDPDALEAKVRVAWSPEQAAMVTGLEARRIEQLARAYATTPPAIIRLNYGLQRHHGGGAAVKAVISLPSVIGAWRHAGGGALLSTSGAYPTRLDALARPDLIPKRADGTLPRLINMNELGRALDPILTRDPAIECLFVYCANPAASNPDQEAVLRGLRREDLFTVVHELFMTDTARYADVILPATSQLEQTDIHKSYGHLDVLLNDPVIAPLGESVSNTELFRRLAHRMGLPEPCLQDSDEALLHQAFDFSHPAMRGLGVERLRADGPQRLAHDAPFAPFREGGFFGTPGGKAKLAGHDEAPLFVAPRELPVASTEPETLSLISSPAHHFLNSSFANLPFAARAEAGPTLHLHSEDAAAREIREGESVRVWNERGAFEATARVSQDLRPGVVWAPSVWWLSASPGGHNANAVTSQGLTDIGGGATFYDCAVHVAPLRRLQVRGIDPPPPRRE